MKFNTVLLNLVRKKELKNIGALGILQVSNQIIPLIIIPLVTHKIGIENYGIIAVSLSILYAQKVLIDLGLDLFGVAWIGKYRDLPKRLNSFIWNSIFLKLLIWFISLLLLFLVYLLTNLDVKLINVLVIGQLWLIGETLFLKFFYQTTERIGWITIFSILSKGIMLIIMMILFQSSNSIMTYPLAMGLGSIISGLTAIIYLINRRIISFEKPKFKIMIYIIGRNKELLLGKTIVYGYSHFLTFVVQYLFGFRYNAYFAICQKLVGGASGMLTPLSEVLFPDLSRRADQKSKSEFYKTFSRNLKALITISILPILGIYFFHERILEIFIGENYPEEINIFFILLSFTIIFGQIGLLFTQLMTIIQSFKYYLLNVTITLISTLFGSFLLGNYFGILGIVYGIIIGQIIHSTLYFYKLQLLT